MEVEGRDVEPEGSEKVAADWESRRLCSDENCIGVIGSDGRCKECGKPFAGEPLGPARPPEGQARPAAAPQPELAESGGPAEGWENRRLCSDGNCIGVIGSDGRCKECGKPYSE